ncbi:FMN-binding negative transcriptional regulator [Jatrophihabitans sp. DSM 45814]
MYVPNHFAMDESELASLLGSIGAADLITPTETGLVATFLPLLYDPDTGEHGSLLCHVARNNDHWRAGQQPDAMPKSERPESERPESERPESLVIVRGPDAYISPSFYASKLADGRVVPTWNYVTAHIYGRLVVHDDISWLRTLVTRLTERHEAQFDKPWAVTDAPEKYIDGQLRAIVGLELQITRIEAKAKLSQNRSEADREGVVAGLTAIQNGAIQNGATPMPAEMAAAVQATMPASTEVRQARQS